MTDDQMDLSHVSEKFREIVHLPDEHRAGFINNHRWIAYPTAKRVIDELNALVTYPRQTRMPSLLIIGKPNNGKSSILEKFEELNPPSDENAADDDLIIPVMKVEASDGREVSLFLYNLKTKGPILTHKKIGPALRFHTLKRREDQKEKCLYLLDGRSNLPPLRPTNNNQGFDPLFFLKSHTLLPSGGGPRRARLTSPNMMLNIRVGLQRSNYQLGL